MIIIPALYGAVDSTHAHCSYSLLNTHTQAPGPMLRRLSKGPTAQAVNRRSLTAEDRVQF